MFKIHLIWTHATLEHLFPSSFYWNNSIAFHLIIFPLVVEINSHIICICLYLIWNMKYPTAVMTVGLYLHNYCGLNKKNIYMSPKLVYFLTWSLVSESCGILLEEECHCGMAQRLESRPEHYIFSVWLLGMGKMWSDCFRTARLAP